MTRLMGIYRRVSTDEQASVIEGSIDNQKHRIEAYIQMKNASEFGWGKVVEIYTDDGFSAKDTNRPAYKRMMKDLKRGKINMIVVTELSRLSRNIPDFCDFLKSLDSQNAKFLSIKEQFDTSNPAGKMMLFNMINLAQFEREQTSERVAINGHARALRGLLSGSPAILGYDKSPDNRSTFLVNEKEAADVKAIFAAYLDSKTIGRTIPVLEAKGIKPKARASKHNRLVRDGRWTPDSLNFTLQNKSYVGLREINKINKFKDQDHLKPFQRYSVVKASWPAIIDTETFDLVQLNIAANRESERARLDTAEERIYLATRLCRCGECGKSLSGQSAHGRNGIHRYYVHSRKKGDVITCHPKSVRASEVEDGLINHLSEMLLRAGYFDKVAGQIRKTTILSGDEMKAEKTRLQADIAKFSSSIKNTFKLQAVLSDDPESLKEIAAEIKELSQKRKASETALEELKGQVGLESDVDDAIDDLKSRLDSFRRGFTKATGSTRKSLIQGLIHAITVTPKGLEIEYRLKHGLNTTGIDYIQDEPDHGRSNVIHLDLDRRESPFREANSQVQIISASRVRELKDLVGAEGFEPPIRRL